jgi:HPt (histidine-containing phosphotransfer) domain-containing protein
MVAMAPNRFPSTEISAAGSGEPAADAERGGERDEPVIDLVHLSRQTLSDQALEVELLELFERQSARILAQLRQIGANDAKIHSDLAHTLRGSALAIGAGRVARAAQAYEARCTPPRGAAANVALDELGEAVTEARATIAQLLGP